MVLFHLKPNRIFIFALSLLKLCKLRFVYRQGSFAPGFSNFAGISHSFTSSVLFCCQKITNRDRLRGLTKKLRAKQIARRA